MEVNPSTEKTVGEKTSRDFFLGLSLALISTLFIGSSFVIKKIGLNRLSGKGSLRAGLGGFGYLKEWIWWLGLLTMGAGELANFTAYAFAPASLVTPLGALSVLVSTILASKFLNEHLNLLGKLSCILCLLGAVIIVIHSPTEEAVDIPKLLERLQSPGFIFYVCAVITTVFLIIFQVGPRYGDRNVLIYILLCSTVGSLTVVSCKGLGLVLKITFTKGSNDLNDFLIYAFFVTVIICILIQMNYLNKALDLFSTNIVTPVYYVFFTTFVIIASSIIFNEWSSLKAEDVIGNLCGFLIVVIAIFMLNVFRDEKRFFE